MVISKIVTSRIWLFRFSQSVLLAFKLLLFLYFVYNFYYTLLFVLLLFVNYKYFSSCHWKFKKFKLSLEIQIPILYGKLYWAKQAILAKNQHTPEREKIKNKRSVHNRNKLSVKKPTDFCFGQERSTATLWIPIHTVNLWSTLNKCSKEKDFLWGEISTDFLLPALNE